MGTVVAIPTPPRISLPAGTMREVRLQNDTISFEQDVSFPHDEPGGYDIMDIGGMKVLHVYNGKATLQYDPNARSVHFMWYLLPPPPALAPSESGIIMFRHCGFGFWAQGDELNVSVGGLYNFTFKKEPGDEGWGWFKTTITDLGGECKVKINNKEVTYVKSIKPLLFSADELGFFHVAHEVSSLYVSQIYVQLPSAGEEPKKLCPEGYIAFGDFCCPEGTVLKDGLCCPPWAIVTNGMCCPPGYIGIPSEGVCCPPERAIDAIHCCPEGTIAIKDRCCPTETTQEFFKVMSKVLSGKITIREAIDILLYRGGECRFCPENEIWISLAGHNFCIHYLVFILLAVIPIILAFGLIKAK